MMMMYQDMQTDLDIENGKFITRDIQVNGKYSG